MLEFRYTPSMVWSLKYGDKYGYSLKVNQTSLSSKTLISHRKGAVECWVNGLLLLKLRFFIFFLKKKKNQKKKKKYFLPCGYRGFCRGGLETNSNCPPPAYPQLPLGTVCPLHPGSCPPARVNTITRRPARRTLVAVPGPPCLPRPCLLPVAYSTSFNGRS